MTRYYFLTKRKFRPEWLYQWVLRQVVRVDEWPKEKADEYRLMVPQVKK